MKCVHHAEDVIGDICATPSCRREPKYSTKYCDNCMDDIEADELEAAEADERIAIENRVLYAMLFLAGMRIGEVAALRWCDYDPKTQPLGRLVVLIDEEKEKRDHE